MVNETCEKVREELPALHYGDLEGAERASVEGHLAGCAPCRAALDAVRETAASLDALPLPAPSPEEWVRLDARIETRVAPLRAARMARTIGRFPVLARVAAAFLVGGLGVLSGGLYLRSRGQAEEIALLHRQVADYAWEKGDIARAAEGYRDYLLVTARELPDERAVRERLEAVRDVDPEVARLYMPARQPGASEREVRERIAHLLATYPLHPLSDQAFAALQKRGVPTPPPLEQAVARPVSVFPSRPLEGETLPEAWRRAVARQREMAAAAGDARVAAYALLRAGHLAEESLKDRALALSLYREAAAALPGGGPIAEAARGRVAALAGAAGE
jgi:hypothetical protein